MFFNTTSKVLIFISVLLTISSFQAAVVAQEERSTILTAERITEPIEIDGIANELEWELAKELVTVAKDGSIGTVDISLKALYDDENIYILVSWPDNSRSVQKKIWTYKEGNWTTSEDEDRLAFIWNIEGSIEGFDIAGCGMLCHGDRMHTNSPGEKGDLWRWRAARSNPIGHMDDGWLDDTILDSPGHEAQEAALHWDEGATMYEENLNVRGDGPRYFEPETQNNEDATFLFWYELEMGDAVEMDEEFSLRKGMSVPGYILSEPTSSRGDISAKGVWENGIWSLEIRRSLKTENPDDVQFETFKIYRFGIAVMDNTGGFVGYKDGHSFDLGARTLEFGGKGSKEVIELTLVRDYLVSAKAYVTRNESGLALSTISNALVIFNRIRDPIASLDPELFIKLRNNFVDSRRNPSSENINSLLENVDLAILTLQGKRKPPKSKLSLKILVLWGKIQVYVFIALSALVLLPIMKMVKIIKRSEFRYLSIFMLMIISPIFLEGIGRLGVVINKPFLQNFSFTTSEYITLLWALLMFTALYIGRIGFNEIDNTLRSLEYYSKELENKMVELRKSQEQLLRTERLASIGQLAASMAHELRNPLGVIKNVSYYIKMGLGKSDEKIKKHLNILDQELAASNKIITELLDFSSGKPPVLVKTDINFLIKDAISKADLPENVSLQLKLNKKLPKLRADEDQLQRVIFNLIVNAKQAMPNGGKLTIKSEQKDSNIFVDLTDSGTGISEEDLKMIFEPLFTTKAKGIGLGLALSKQIIEVHGGTIEARSEVGRGTTFIIKLPLEMEGTKETLSNLESKRNMEVEFK
jgi:signal transduction histidine kinase